MLRLVPRSTARAVLLTHARLFKSTAQTDPAPAANVKVAEKVKKATGFGAPSESEFDPVQAHQTLSEEDVRADHGPDPPGAGKKLNLKAEVNLDEPVAPMEAGAKQGKTQ